MRPSSSLLSPNARLYRKEADLNSLFAVQHGADLPAWFGNPEGDDEPMVQLSWEMTGYLMCVSLS